MAGIPSRSAPGHRRPSISPLSLTLATALYLALTANFALWRWLFAQLGAPGPREVAFAGALFVLLVALVCALLLPFALPRLLKGAVIALLLVSAAAAHFMDAYGVVIDEDMIRNVVQTNAREALGLATPALALRLLVLGALPSLAVARLPLRSRSLGAEAWVRVRALALCVVVVGATFAAGYEQIVVFGREHQELRLLPNPLAPLASAVAFAVHQQREATGISPIALDARRTVAAGPGARPKLFVLVVGETARAQSFSLNGYARETNPELAHAGVIDFTNVSSCGTATSVSVPCMFSGLGREDYSEGDAATHEGLLDVLQRVGVAVRWRDNDSGCKGVCDRVPFEKEKDLRVRRLCPGDDCWDDVLLRGLAPLIETLSADTLLVLHTRGSHGPAYHERTPPAWKRFLPECTRADVEHCTREEIVNAYDNSILYTDHVLAELIALLAAHADRVDPALLYVSDHGESLGEHGLYLHGLPWFLAPEEQKHVPMVLWLAPGFARAAGVDAACVAAHRGDALSHDAIFHTLLGVFDVATSAYQPGLDLFAPCRRAPTSSPAPARRASGAGRRPTAS